MKVLFTNNKICLTEMNGIVEGACHFRILPLLSFSMSSAADAVNLFSCLPFLDLLL